MTVAESLKALEFLFRADIEPSRVAAIIIEPVQGEGRVLRGPGGVAAWRCGSICDQHGILLIADEVQSGFARTGRCSPSSIAGCSPIW